MSYLIGFRGPQVLTQILHRLLLIFLGKLIGPNHQHGPISISYTSDHCVFGDDAVHLLIVDVTELDPREALHDMGNSSKEVVAKVHHLRDALETIGKPFTVVDAKVLLTLGKPSINMGNPFG